jgi:hypothetical protein
MSCREHKTSGRRTSRTHCSEPSIPSPTRSEHGPAFSLVTGNTIHDTHVRKLFTGAEVAGIKFHGAIDTEISGNHIYRACRGLWLNWMAQGTRVARTSSTTTTARTSSWR